MNKMLFVVGIQALGNPLCLAQRCAIEAILQKIDFCPHQMVFFPLRGAFLNKSKDRGLNQRTVLEWSVQRGWIRHIFSRFQSIDNGVGAKARPFKKVHKC
jgi:hypothetical protein